MSSHLVETAVNLSLSERVELIEALWQSIAEEGYEPPLTPEQAHELDRRLEAHRANPQDTISWDSIKQEILARYTSS